MNIRENKLIKNDISDNNLTNSKNSLLIYNVLRNLGLISTLKGTKLLNKAIQIAIKNNDEFVVIEDIYKQISLNYPIFNTVQIRNNIKYAIETNRNQLIILKRYLVINMIVIFLQIKS